MDVRADCRSRERGRGAPRRAFRLDVYRGALRYFLVSFACFFVHVAATVGELRGSGPDPGNRVEVPDGPGQD